MKPSEVLRELYVLNGKVQKVWEGLQTLIQRFEAGEDWLVQKGLLDCDIALAEEEES